MEKSNLDKLIRLYREGYISRDELISQSKKAILQKDKTNDRLSSQQPTRSTQPQKQRPPVSAPIQAIIDLDKPPKVIGRLSPSGASGLTLWNGRVNNNPILAPMLGGVLIAMAIIALTIIVIDSNSEQDVKTQAQSTSTVDSLANSKNPDNAIQQLEQIAKEFELSSHWSNAKIALFKDAWTSLSQQQQAAARKSHWFKTHSLILEIQLSQIHSLSNENPSNASLRQEWQTLRDLSIALGSPVPAFNDSTIKSHKKIKISDIESDLAKSQHAAKPAATIAINAEKASSEPKLPAKATSAVAISTIPKLEKLLSDYVGDYESGDLDHIVKLFNGSGWHQGKIGDYELRESFKDTFSNTSNRKMVIDNVNWSFKGNTALATGTLTLLYTDNKDSQQHKQHGSIRLVATLKNNEYRFSNLYHIME